MIDQETADNIAVQSQKLHRAARTNGRGPGTAGENGNLTDHVRCRQHRQGDVAMRRVDIHRQFTGHQKIGKRPRIALAKQNSAGGGIFNRTGFCNVSQVLLVHGGKNVVRL
jgi:hypothetical protein